MLVEFLGALQASLPLHQTLAPQRLLGCQLQVFAIFSRSQQRPVLARVLLYSKVRRGTQVAQGRGLQNLHSWVRIPPAPPNLWFYFQSVNGSFFPSNSRV